MALRTAHPLSHRRKPGIYNGPARLLSQERMAPNCWKMTLEIPWCGEVDAGQFVHLHCAPGETAPLLRRPFSIWDVRREGRNSTRIDLVYTTVGHGTRRLAALEPGTELPWLGPLGRGFNRRAKERTILFVAGGVGIVPFYLLARQWNEQAKPPRMILLFGGRTESMLYGIDEFPPLGVEARAVTEDGSRGRKGRVTLLLEEHLRREGTKGTRVLACGPEPMLEAVLDVCRRRRVPCEISMEKRMGCALGACGACVTPVRDGADWRYSRICIEGPCYPAEELVSSHEVRS